MTDIPEEAGAPECEFCGFDSDEPGWITERPGDGYGTGPAREPMMLCQLCRRSYAVSRWKASGRYENAERDQLMIGNVLRQTIREVLRD